MTWAALALLAGARARRVQGTLEIGGGRLGALLATRRFGFGFSAITFGHVILGVDLDTLGTLRMHEQVHVRQYERWGPFFIPAYLLESLWARLRGLDAYRGNRFEQEAFRLERGADAPP